MFTTSRSLVKLRLRVDNAPSVRMMFSMGKTDTNYRKDIDYRFHFVSGGSEPATYLGKNNRGMARFLLSDGSIWTGFSAPVTAE